MEKEKVFRSIPKEEEIGKLLETLKGKVILIYGEPLVGKSFTLAKLSSKTENGFYFLWIDTNLRGEWGNELRKILKGKVDYIYSYPALTTKLLTIKNSGKEDFGYNGLVIDSMSGLEEQLTSTESPGSPRRTLIMSQAFRTITYLASVIAKKFNIPVFLITHSVRIFPDQPKFFDLDEKPAFTRRAMKNVDVIIYQEKGIWHILAWRKLNFKPMEVKV